MSRYDQSIQYRRQKLFIGGFYICAGRIDIENLLKSLLIQAIVSHILISRPWGFVWRGEAHQRIPVATGLRPPELPISDENDAHDCKHRCEAVLEHTQGCHIKIETETNDASKRQLNQAS